MAGEYSVVDLFAGCGGLSKGFELAGFKIAAAFDSLDLAVECYKMNFPNSEVKQLDLSNTERVVKEIKRLQPTGVIGGPPCQDFSSAGKRVEGARATLTGSFASIVIKTKPRFFVMENVPLARKSEAYKEAKNKLKNAGYGLTERVFDASLFGVPQKRKRLFLVGFLNGKGDEILKVADYREALIPMTIRDKYPSFGTEYYYRHPRTYFRRAVFSIDEPSPTIRGVNRPMPKNYKIHPGDRASGDDIKPLSTQQRALVQTFPKQYRWPNAPASKLDQLIGNAVPVELAHSIGDMVLGVINGEEGCPNSFIRWLSEEKGYTHEGAKDIRTYLRKYAAMARCSGSYDEEKDKKPAQGVNGQQQKRIKRSLSLYEEYLSKTPGAKPEFTIKKEM